MLIAIFSEYDVLCIRFPSFLYNASRLSSSGFALLDLVYNLAYLLRISDR
ncbi:hypothetical protein [Nostoc sp.]